MSIICSSEYGLILQTTFGFKKTRGVFLTLSMTIFEDCLNDYSSVFAIRSSFVSFDRPSVMPALV